LARFAAVLSEIRCSAQQGWLKLSETCCRTESDLLQCAERFAVALEEVCYSTQQGSLGLSTRFAVVLYEVTVVLNEVAVFTEFFGSLIGEGIHASAYPVEPPVVVVPKSRTGLLFISSQLFELLDA
jgi:hypothetical protein